MQKNKWVFYWLCMLGAMGAMAQKPDTAQSVYNNSHKISDKRNTKAYPGYINIATNVGENFTHNPPINLTLSFPYSSSLQPGVQQTFTAYKPNMAARHVLNINFISGKIGYEKVFVEFGGGEFTTGSSSVSNFKKDMYGNLGIGAMLPFGGVTKRFALQASVNWCGSEFDVPLGSINNNNCTVSVMGLNSEPTFAYQVPHQSGKSTTYTTAYATTNSLDVSMTEQQTFIYPKLTLSNNPLTHVFYWAAAVGYYIPTKHTEYLNFGQLGAGQAAASLGKVDFVSSGIALQNNGSPVSTVPFNMRGFSIMFTIGINVHVR